MFKFFIYKILCCETMTILKIVIKKFILLSGLSDYKLKRDFKYYWYFILLIKQAIKELLDNMVNNQKVFVNNKDFIISNIMLSYGNNLSLEYKYKILEKNLRNGILVRESLNSFHLFRNQEP